MTVAKEPRTDVRAYLAGLERASAFEIEELRRTPVAVKLRQIESLMTAAALLESDVEREAGLAAVRERWRLIRLALR